MTTSEWPLRYFEAALIEKSTPWARGLKRSGVAQVLSAATSAPRAWAAATIAGTSCTSMVTDPGDSTQTSGVSSVSRSAMRAPSMGS